MEFIVPQQFETLPPRPSRNIDGVAWRPDHDGGDEDNSGAGFDTIMRVDETFGTLDWWINHPHSPRNLKPIILIGTLSGSGARAWLPWPWSPTAVWLW